MSCSKRLSLSYSPVAAESRQVNSCGKTIGDRSKMMVFSLLLTNIAQRHPVLKQDQRVVGKSRLTRAGQEAATLRGRWQVPELSERNCL